VCCQRVEAASWLVRLGLGVRVSARQIDFDQFSSLGVAERKGGREESRVYSYIHPFGS